MDQHALETEPRAVQERQREALAGLAVERSVSR